MQPGKIVDILADPVRNYVYLLRQDKNVVLVYDGTTLKPVMCGDQPCQLRTGNTPVSMAITDDQQFLIVGNDRSHLASVFNLDLLQADVPIVFDDGYPRSIGVAHNGIWATVRVVSSPKGMPCDGPPPSNPLYRVDFNNRVANAPTTLGVYCNQVPADSILAGTPSKNYLLLAMTDGTAAMWDAGADTWVLSRTNGTAAGGAFGAFDDDHFVVDNRVLDPGLFPIATLESTSGSSSGVGVSNDGSVGLRSTNATDSGPGTIEKVDLNTLESFNAKSTIGGAGTGVHSEHATNRADRTESSAVYPHFGGSRRRYDIAADTVRAHRACGQFRCTDTYARSNGAGKCRRWRRGSGSRWSRSGARQRTRPAFGNRYEFASALHFRGRLRDGGKYRSAAIPRFPDRSSGAAALRS